MTLLRAVRRHVDLQTEGTEKCNRALDAVVRLPEAQELLEEAKDRFRDVTCMGLSNWANVHTCVAKKLAEHAAEEGRGCDNIRTEFDAACAEAIKRYEQALEFNGVTFSSHARFLPPRLQL